MEIAAVLNRMDNIIAMCNSFDELTNYKQSTDISLITVDDGILYFALQDGLNEVCAAVNSVTNFINSKKTFYFPKNLKPVIMVPFKINNIVINDFLKQCDTYLTTAENNLNIDIEVLTNYGYLPEDFNYVNKTTNENAYGEVLKDVVWYDQDRKVYVATDSNGSTLTGTGIIESPTGKDNVVKSRRNKKDHIDLGIDMLDYDVIDYIDTVSSHQNANTVSFLQVTDTHYDQGNILIEQDYPHAQPGIGKGNYKMTNPYYNQFIGREGHKDMFKNIGKIASHFKVPVQFAMHTGDIIDGAPNNVDERFHSLDIALNAMDDGLKMKNYVTMGNHDLMRGEPEQGNPNVVRTLPDRRLINQRLMQHVLNQRGGAKIASMDHGYYRIFDGVHKMVYIMINTHDNQDTTPGQANTQGAISKAQVDWLVETLKMIPEDYHVVFFGHHTLPPAKWKKSAPSNDYTWWLYNLNGDVVTDIIQAFQLSQAVTTYTKQTYVWQPKEFVGRWRVDFTGRKKGRVIEYAAGHQHNNYQWPASITNYNINTIIEENMPGEMWDNFGTNHSSQFAVHTINFVTGKLYVDRFAPTNHPENQYSVFDFTI